MARPGSGGSKQSSIKGTVGGDVITVGEFGVTINGVFRDYAASKIDAGFKISGLGGDDIITGGRGYDLLYGGSGDDTLADHPLGALFDGGLGLDTLDFSGASAGVYVDIGYGGFIDDDFTVTITNGWRHESGYGDGVSETIAGIEAVKGSGHADHIWGDRWDNILFGGGGSDFLSGSGGNDTANGGLGDDYIAGGQGSNTLSGGGGVDRFFFDGVSQDYDAGATDVITDFGSDDYLILLLGGQAPTWQVGDYQGEDSLFGTYDGGKSLIILVGVTSIGAGQCFVGTGPWLTGEP